MILILTNLNVHFTLVYLMVMDLENFQFFFWFFFDFNFEDFDFHFDKFQFSCQCGGPLMCACYYYYWTPALADWGSMNSLSSVCLHTSQSNQYSLSVSPISVIHVIIPVPSCIFSSILPSFRYHLFLSSMLLFPSLHTFLEIITSIWCQSFHIIVIVITVTA